MPVHDVHDQILWLKANRIVVALHIQPVNLHLLSEAEKRRKVKAFEEVLNGIDTSFQILSIARPVDLDPYIASLRQKKAEATGVKSRLLAGYIQQAAQMAISGETVERHFYLLLSQTLDKKQKDYAQLLQRAKELASRLTAIDLITHVCDDEELRNLLFLFFHPEQAAYERGPTENILIPPIWREDHG